MRNILDVIGQIVGIVKKEAYLSPEDEETLMVHLTGIEKASRYLAPEVQQGQWRNLSNVLNDLLGEPDAGWKERVDRVMRGE